MIMEYTKQLQQLGLTEQEAQVYVALLGKGRSTGYALAMQCGIDRSGIYFVLQGLREKGLIMQSPHAHRHYYIAKNPKDFLLQKRNEVQEFENIVPQLMQQTQGHDIKTLHFDGAYTGSKNSMQYILQNTSSKEAVAFISYAPGGAPHKINEIARSMIRLITEHGIRVRGIVPEADELRIFIDDFKSLEWDIRALPLEEYAFKSSFFVIGPFMRITSRGRAMSAVIKNDEVADAMRQTFEILWKQGKKFV